MWYSNSSPKTSNYTVAASSTRAEKEVKNKLGSNVFNFDILFQTRVINKFRNVKHGFPYRKGMLLGTFARNQFSHFSALCEKVFISKSKLTS